MKYGLKLGTNRWVACATFTSSGFEIQSTDKETEAAKCSPRVVAERLRKLCPTSHVVSLTELESDADALAVLERHGVKHDGGRIRLEKGVKYEAELLEACDYLCNEWDYDYE